MPRRAAAHKGTGRIEGVLHRERRNRQGTLDEDTRDPESASSKLLESLSSFSRRQLVKYPRRRRAGVQEGIDSNADSKNRHGITCARLDTALTLTPCRLHTGLYMPG